MTHEHDPDTEQLAENLFSEMQQDNAQRMDRLFSGLMLFQWLLAIILAWFISPETWVGAESQAHFHIYAALFLGGMLSALPIAMAWKFPGQPATRYVIAIAQVLFSTLLIHITGGRIETHFHLFGSLAFLAMYRDWKVIIIATLVITIDHGLRGIFWPESIFGLVASSPWRVVEHAAWVVFEDIILVWSCYVSTQELHKSATQQASMQTQHKQVQELLKEVDRTQEYAVFIDQISEILHKLSTKDISARIGEEHDDFYAVRIALNTATSTLDKSMSQVKRAAGGLEEVSHKLNVQNQRLHEGSNLQTQRLQGVKETLATLSERSVQSAQMSRSAIDLVQESLRSTAHGRSQMQTLSQTMEQIQNASKETSKIVRIVDEIAFQTNLLALNAAVEAARAGQAGKGFAIVAEEVRKLAKRCSEAAQNIGSLIQKSTRIAGEGVALNQEVMTSLEQISARVTHTGEVFQAMHETIDQQSTEIEEINRSAIDMSQINHRNGEVAHVLGEVVTHINHQMASMGQLVRSFRLSSAERSPSRSFSETPMPDHVNKKYPF